jgi:hypothetical protein
MQIHLHWQSDFLDCIISNLGVVATKKSAFLTALLII